MITETTYHSFVTKVEEGEVYISILNTQGGEDAMVIMTGEQAQHLRDNINNCIIEIETSKRKDA